MILLIENLYSMRMMREKKLNTCWRVAKILHSMQTFNYNIYSDVKYRLLRPRGDCAVLMAQSLQRDITKKYDSCASRVRVNLRKLNWADEKAKNLGTDWSFDVHTQQCTLQLNSSRPKRPKTPLTSYWTTTTVNV